MGKAWQAGLGYAPVPAEERPLHHGESSSSLAGLEGGKGGVAGGSSGALLAMEASLQVRRWQAAGVSGAWTCCRAPAGGRHSGAERAARELLR